MARDILKEMKDYKKELQRVFEVSRSLKAVSKYSYEQRESGRDVPYMMISDRVDKGLTRISASPLVSQNELCAFFRELAPGMHVVPRYLLFGDTEGIHLTERSKYNKVYKVVEL